MKNIILQIYILLLVFSNSSFGQDLAITKNVKEAYRVGTRDISGAPGKLYWQNTGDYTIKIKFDPATRLLKGIVDIEYINNSNNTLAQLVFKLYPNLYKTDAIRNMYINLKDLGNGVQIKSFIIDNEYIDSTRYKIIGTNMYVGNKIILPKQKVHITVNYSYLLNAGSFIRTGQIDTGAFFIAYFFPRVAVYDDIDGWNEHPYLGKEEFYNDFGNFHVEITVPDYYQVWATGELKNKHEVFTNEIIHRLELAQQSDSIINIITTGDLQNGHVTNKNKDSVNTWIFEARNVVDFSFSISNHYEWKSTSVMVDSISKRRTRVDAVFNPDHEVFLPVVSYARKTVELISHYFPKIPFPYSHITVFEGLDAMEYPMMVNILLFKDSADALELTTHEVFHSLFPFYVANNETKYSFMDEGLATLTEFMFHPLIDSTIPLNYDISPVNLSAGTDEDMPIMTPTPQLYGKARFANKDLKPALAYLYLQEMLGESQFLKALQLYITRWEGKHPTPYDFFNSINSGSGKDLNWFWKNWFFEKYVPDLAISKVNYRKLNYSVEISSPGTLAVPIHLAIIYENGSKETITKDISCWANGRKPINLKFKAKMKVKQLVLGNAYDVDINPENNKWTF